VAAEFSPLPQSKGSPMITKAKFTRDFRCFKQGATFVFRPGVNILVGDQGTGKSTLMQQIAALSKLPKHLHEHPPVEVDAEQRTTLLSFNFESDNPRSRPFPDDQARFMPSLVSRLMSHGQMVFGVLERLKSEKQPSTFLMDEPDMALSIRSVRKLAELLKASAENGHQLICSAHNPLLIGAFSEVLSLEHKCWINSDEFMKSHMVD
jgi:predicted ATPase